MFILDILYIKIVSQFKYSKGNKDKVAKINSCRNLKNEILPADLLVEDLLQNKTKFNIMTVRLLSLQQIHVPLKYFQFSTVEIFSKNDLGSIVISEILFSKEKAVCSYDSHFT